MLSLVVLMVFSVTSIFTAGAETVAASNNNQNQALAHDTRVLRHNIRVILADPRFNYPDHWGPLKKLWLTIREWLAKLKLSKKPVDNLILQKVLRWVGLGCLAVLPVVLIYFLPKMFVHSGGVKSLPNKKFTKKVRSEDLKIQAGILAEKGQFREAVRLLYLAGLEHLKMNGILPDGIRLTDKANLNIISRTFGPENSGYQAFRELVLVFQEKWYGLRSCQAEDYYRLIEYLKIMEANMGKPHV